MAVILAYPGVCEYVVMVLAVDGLCWLMLWVMASKTDFQLNLISATFLLDIWLLLKLTSARYIKHIKFTTFLSWVHLERLIKIPASYHCDIRFHSTYFRWWCSFIKPKTRNNRDAFGFIQRTCTGRLGVCSIFEVSLSEIGYCNQFSDGKLYI
jgi:hypothetical protein